MSLDKEKIVVLNKCEKDNCTSFCKNIVFYIKMLCNVFFCKMFCVKRSKNTCKISGIILLLIGFTIGVAVSCFGYNKYINNNYDIHKIIGSDYNKMNILLNGNNYLEVRGIKTETQGKGNIDVKLMTGENLVSMLIRNNFSRENVNKIIETLVGEMNFQGISDKQVFHIEYDFETKFKSYDKFDRKKYISKFKNRNDKHINSDELSEPMPMFLVEDRYISKLSFKKGNGNKYIVERSGDGYLLHIEKPKLIIKTHIITGTITNNLFTDVLTSDIKISTLYNMLNEYAFLIDFQRDLQKGDKFIFLLDTTKDADGDVIDEKIRYSNLVLSKGKYEMFNFRGKYFDRKGRSVQKGLLKTPVDGARLTSRFQLKRKHPILGYTRAHKGVDLAAPIGTPIYAAGDGVVSEVHLNHNAYGKFISIKHNNEYSTRYAHMSRVAKLRVGSPVKQRQVIGYVGMTGLATGPHLHYEVLRHGIQINPSTMKITSVKKISNDLMPKFKNVVSEIDDLLKPTDE